MRLLNSLSAISYQSNSSQKLKTEELLLKNYDDFFGLIQHFGMGMVIFPRLMMDLGGTYSISVIPGENIKVSQNEEPRAGRDQDQSPDQAQSSGHLKIQFKLPFNQAGMSKKVMNPYFPFNPNKEDTNGKKIFKSPMLKTRESRSRIKNDMKRIMEEQLKSPMLSGARRPLGIGTPAGSGVFSHINESSANSIGSMGLGRINQPSDIGNKSLFAHHLLNNATPQRLVGGAEHAHDFHVPSLPHNAVPQQIIEEEVKTEGSSRSLIKNHLS